MMGIFAAIGRALTGAAARGKAAASKVTQRFRGSRRKQPKVPETPKASEMQKAIKQPKAPQTVAVEKGLFEHPYMNKRQTQIFYSQTKRFWQGLPNEMRDEAILKGLGVDSMDEAYNIIMDEAARKMKGKLPENWESLTDDERYDYIMSLLAFR